MIRIFLFTLILFISTRAFADTTVVMSNIACIDMPGYPDTLTKGKAKGYTCYWNGFIYEALSAKDPKVKNMDFTDAELEEYYDAYTSTMIAEMKGKLKEQKRFYMSGFIGRYMYFEANNKVNLPQLWYTQVILLDKTVIVVSVTAAKGKRKDLEWYQSNYFASFRMAGDMKNVHQGTEDRKPAETRYEYEGFKDNAPEKNNNKYALGEHLRWIITITSLSITVTALGIGLFFLIRYLYKRYD